MVGFDPPRRTFLEGDSHKPYRIGKEEVLNFDRAKFLNSHAAFQAGCTSEPHRLRNRLTDMYALRYSNI